MDITVTVSAERRLESYVEVMISALQEMLWECCAAQPGDCFEFWLIWVMLPSSKCGR